MKKFTKWHKESVNTFIKKTSMGILLMVFLSGCYVYGGAYPQEQKTKHSCELMDRGQSCLSDHSCCKKEDEISYWRTNYVPTVSLYYYDNLPYWGYYSGHYYYYGYRHIYPWWYYYNSTPPYYYGITTHVNCHIGNSGYVYRPRGNWRHNNRTNLRYHHDKIHNTGIKVKNNSNRPVRWRNTKVSVTRSNRPTVRNVNNQIIPIRSTNVKTNTRVTVTPNRNTKVKTNTRVKTNRTNTNRSNKSNNRRPR